MKYAVAVVLYNPSISVEEHISVYLSVSFFYKVYIVDNSDDENINLSNVILSNNRVQYISMNGNKGMSIALTAAYNIAMEDGMDFLLTMDQDSQYTKSNIEKMIRYIESNNDPSIAIYVANFAKIYWDHNYKKKIIGEYVVGDNEIKNVSMCLTSSSFVRLTAVKELLPLENFFIGYVDNMISAELIERGYILVRVGESKFEQQVGYPVVYSKWNERLRIVKHSSTRYYYMYRNCFYYMKRFSYNKKIKNKCVLMRLRYLFNILLVEEKKICKLRACYYGYKDYKKGVLGPIPRERQKRIQSGRIK